MRAVFVWQKIPWYSVGTILNKDSVKIILGVLFLLASVLGLVIFARGSVDYVAEPENAYVQPVYTEAPCPPQESAPYRVGQKVSPSFIVADVGPLKTSCPISGDNFHVEFSGVAVIKGTFSWNDFGGSYTFDPDSEKKLPGGRDPVYVRNADLATNPKLYKEIAKLAESKQMVTVELSNYMLGFFAGSDAGGSIADITILP